MDTVTLTIDGRQVTVAKGKTVLQAAIEAGISIPYYCYHPGISVDGSCRVCIVKVEKMPKLQTSCSTTCAEGMIVQTATPEVVQARAGPWYMIWSPVSPPEKAEKGSGRARESLWKQSRLPSTAGR